MLLFSHWNSLVRVKKKEAWQKGPLILDTWIKGSNQSKLLAIKAAWEKWSSIQMPDESATPEQVPTLVNASS